MYRAIPLLTVLVLGVTNVDAAAARAPEPKIGRCFVRLDGWEAGSRHCEYNTADDGSFELWPDPPSNEYEMVDIRGATASGYSHGSGNLGAMQKRGACWVNKRARICLWRK